MKECEIAKIIFDIDGKEIELTMKQAEELKEELCKFFEFRKKEKRKENNSYIYWPWFASWPV